MQLVKLRSMDNLSSIIDHWKHHCIVDKHYDESCEILICRHNFLISKNSTPWNSPPPPPLYTIEDLELLSVSTKSLAIKNKMVGKFFATRGKTFKGSLHLVDIKFMEKIAARDPSALE